MKRSIKLNLDLLDKQTIEPFIEGDSSSYDEALTTSLEEESTEMLEESKDKKSRSYKEIIQEFEEKGGELIGQGGDGKVYKFEDYAIKVYNELQIMGMDVYEKLAGKVHPYVIDTHHLVVNDTMFEVMPFYKDGNLGQHLWMFRDNDELQEELFKQIWEAIEFLHLHEIQHRDLKTGNILVESINPLKIRVCDFGRSRVNANSMSITQSVGTFKFMAPEALAGMPVKGSDLFSVGIIMAMAASGGDPFKNGGHLVDNELNWSTLKCTPKMKRRIKSLTQKIPQKRGIETDSWFRKLLDTIKNWFTILDENTYYGRIPPPPPPRPQKPSSAKEAKETLVKYNLMLEKYTKEIYKKTNKYESKFY